MIRGVSLREPIEEPPRYGMTWLDWVYDLIGALPFLFFLVVVPIIIAIGALTGS